MKPLLTISAVVLLPLFLAGYRNGDGRQPNLNPEQPLAHCCHACKNHEVTDQEPAASGDKEKFYRVQGKVVAVAAEKKDVILDHEDIPGLMKAMQMSFKVDSANVLEGIRAGDLVQGKLSVKSGRSVIMDLSLNLRAKGQNPWSEEGRRAAEALAKLSPDDWRLASNQGFCPILKDSPLGSMGTPVKVTIKGKDVLLCCPACKKQALAEPDQTLARTEKLKAGVAKNVDYFCPMHPSIVRESSRYRCPICFMPLSKQRSTPAKQTQEERVQQQKAELAWHRATIVPAIKENLSKLPAPDQVLAEAQGWCPILDANPLGVTGVPFTTTIQGRQVFLCCKECELDAKTYADQTLAKVEQFKALTKKLHEVKGRIVSITVTIEHEDIPGVLKKGRMDFSVEGTKGLENLKAADLIQGKLKLKDGDYRITELNKR